MSLQTLILYSVLRTVLTSPYFTLPGGVFPVVLAPKVVQFDEQFVVVFLLPNTHLYFFLPWFIFPFLPGGVFPVVLAPKVVPFDEQLPAVQLAINETLSTSTSTSSSSSSSSKLSASSSSSLSSSSSPSLRSFDFFSLLVQEMNLKVSETLVWQTQSYIGGIVAKMKRRDAEDTDVRAGGGGGGKSGGGVGGLSSPSPTPLFFRVLLLQPLAINISFEAAPRLRKAFAGGGGGDFNPFAVLLGMAGSLASMVSGVCHSLSLLSYSFFMHAFHDQPMP
jgi:hypothetical protein